MKACNSAGCGNQTSQFATTDYDGSKSLLVFQVFVYLFPLIHVSVTDPCKFYPIFLLLLLSLGTIPPIKSARGEGDDVKKLFSIGSPVILVTLGVALLFIIRKKRKEKRLKRLRGGNETI